MRTSTKINITKSAPKTPFTPAQSGLDPPNSSSSRSLAAINGPAGPLTTVEGLDSGGSNVSIGSEPSPFQPPPTTKADLTSEQRSDHPIKMLKVLDINDDGRAISAEVAEKDGLPGPNCSSRATQAQSASPGLDHDTHKTHTQDIILSTSSPFAQTLAAARMIDDFGRVSYPEGILRPYVKLDPNVKGGIIWYDREFLMQFMTACKERPNICVNLEPLGLDPAHPLPPPPPRKGRAGKAKSTGASKQVTSAKSANTPSTVPSPPEFAGNPVKLGHGQPGASTQKKPQAGSLDPDNIPQQRTRVRSRRNRQSDGTSAIQSQQASSVDTATHAYDNPVPDLQVAENHPDTSGSVEQEVGNLLTELSQETFETNSDQIIQWANQSEKERDAKTMMKVTFLVFEGAVSSAGSSEMYARLCCKMKQQMRNKVQDHRVKGHEDKPISGGQLFKRVLLNKCWEESRKILAGVKNGEYSGLNLENDAAERAKRGFNVTRFLGELFMVRLLTQRIIHEFFRKICDGSKVSTKEGLFEHFCILMTKVGQRLDTPKARIHMDMYFQRMREVSESPGITPRVQTLLQDMINLRERNWQA